MTPNNRFRFQATALFAFLGACALVFTILWRFGGGDVNPISGPYEVQVVVPSAVALADNADVREAGVKVGKVARVENREGVAVLLLELDDEHAPVYRDARALVRTKTLSGENYVDLEPGEPEAGGTASGGILPMENAGESVQLDQIVSALDDTRRRSLQRMLDGLGGGLEGRGEELNELLEGSSAVISESVPVNETLAASRHELAGLVEDLGTVAQALGERKEAIRQIATGGRKFATAVAERDQRLRETLDELPGFLEQARVSAGNLGSFSQQATPVVADLAGAAEVLTPTMDALGPAARQGRLALIALDAFTSSATPLVGELGPFAADASRLMGPLEDNLRELNPAVEYLAPYAQDIGGWIGILRGGTEYRDFLAYYGHALAMVSKSTLAFGQFTPAQREAYEALLETGVLSELGTIGRNPYPRPGTSADPVPFTGDYPRVERDPPYSP